MRHSLETTGSTATLYISGALRLDGVESLCDACDQLPDTVRALRMDLHGVRHLEGEALDALRALLRHWRGMRGGDCRLSFSTKHIIATYSEGPVCIPLRQRLWSETVQPSDAMTAAYL
jgi:ABC-type transporter Mla MlaB component